MWLEKLQRMMAELPAEYKDPEPAGPEDFEIGGNLFQAKKVGKLSKEEIELLGVTRQIQEKIDLEESAHEALHDANQTAHKNCLRNAIGIYLIEQELYAVFQILHLSLSERLGLFESHFVFDGHDIYAIPNSIIETMREESRPVEPEGESDPEQVPGFRLPNWKKIN